jgi:hypothetical protein
LAVGTLEAYDEAVVENLSPKNVANTDARYVTISKSKLPKVKMSKNIENVEKYLKRRKILKMSKNIENVEFI